MLTTVLWMRFTVRPGSDPLAAADRTLLAALGLPSGGVVSVGSSHILIRPGNVPEPTALLLGPAAMANAGVTAGQVVDVKRALLTSARRVTLAGETLPSEPRALVHALQGRPVTAGDRVTIDPSYLAAAEPVTIEVLVVEPDHAGLVGSGTVFATVGGAPPAPTPKVDTVQAPPGTPTTAEALLAGLDTELEVLTGWLSLLSSPDDLPAAWGLPRVAGVLLEGPNGVGKSELVRAAATAAGAGVREVSLDQVFKPERLLDVLEEAVKETPLPGVIFVDRIEAVAGDEALSPFRTQVAAIFRWFLDAIVERGRLACVLGVGSRSVLDPAIANTALLPRTLAIPPPNLERRTLLFRAALARVPSEQLDHERLAARSAGFSGADILAAVIHASTTVARTGGQLTTDMVMEAIEDTTPSLGSVPMGEMPSYGFDRVADLEDVKQRLTEAVIWPVTEPERFARMGIEPPRGVLLHGPPGTGKTFVVRALAHEAGAAFFSVKGAELLDKFVGESERGVRELFARARGAAPAILFFDEFDALAPVRGRSTTTVTDSVVAALLTEIDGVSARGDVAVIAATNRPDLIDPALLRAGRFEVQIELSLPNETARAAMLEMTDVPFAKEVELSRLAEITEGLSFADLDGMLREAALTVLRSGSDRLEVGWAELESAIARYRSRVGEPGAA